MIKSTQRLKKVSIDQGNGLNETQEEKNIKYTRMIEFHNWQKRENQYQTYSQIKKCAYDIKRGEIFEVDWGFNINAEFSKRHYGVVLVDSGPNNPLITICPLKTNHNGAHPASDFDLGIVEGLKEGRTLAVVNQIRTIDKLRLYTRQVINSDMDHEVRLRMSDFLVDKILRAYNMYLHGRPIKNVK